MPSLEGDSRKQGRKELGEPGGLAAGITVEQTGNLARL